jgi:type II secretory pathway component GspD/PulD (secretin)
MFGLLLGWALTHATVFGQTGKIGEEPKSAPAPISKIRAGLDKTVTIDFTGQSLADALNHFRDKTGVPINIDPIMFVQMGLNPNDPMGGQVTIKGTNEKASQILRRTLSAQRLGYVILEDGVLVTSEDGAVMRQMRQRVSVDLDEVPLKKAVRDLAKNHGINLVIDPRVTKEADAPVSLQLDNTGIETALRLLAEMAQLKAVRMGNVVFITDETKAKKIRDEESHQFDNPLNPHNPGMFPPAVIGGAAFGGFAMPARPVQGIADIQIGPGKIPPQAPPVPVEPIVPQKKGEGAPDAPPPPPPPAVRPGAPQVPPPPGVRP